MTVFSVPRVDIGGLRLGAQIGSGGQGRVVPVAGYQIAGQWPAALKIYAPDVAARINATVLEKIAGLPNQLPPDDSRWLQENSAWPAVIAEDRGTVSGFLMRMVPSAYYFGYQTQSQGIRQRLAETAFLLNADSYISSAGLAASDHDRVALLSSVAATLSRLHSLGVVVGDFSPKNILFSLRPAPSCFLIDCDAVQLHGESVLSQIETPDWEAPGGEPRATFATDSYKFGLLAIRLFARDQSSRDPAALAALSADLGYLAVLSQDPNPLRRPAPGAWASALAAARNLASTVPTVSRPMASPRWISMPAPPVGMAPATPGPAPAPVPRPRRPLLVGASILTAIVFVALAVVGIASLTHHHTAITGPPPGTNGGVQDGNGVSPSSQNSSDAPSPAPAQPVKVGPVAISPGLAGDSRADAVAQMFSTYFTGIDQQDYQSAVSVFDPAGQFDPNDPNAVQQFANGVASSRDSRVVLVGLRPAGDQPVRKAEVTFRSHQAAGDGPADDPSETCTDWDLTYTLSDSGGQYLIYKVKGTDSGC